LYLPSDTIIPSQSDPMINTSLKHQTFRF